MRKTLRNALLLAVLTFVAAMTAQAQTKPDMVLTFPDSLVGETVEIALGGSTGDAFQMDWGDGTKQEYTKANYYSNTLHANTIKVYGSKILILIANNCNLTGLEINNEPDIYNIKIQNNNLEKLDLSNCERLRGVYAANNKLTSVKLGANTTSSPSVLDFSNNQLTGTLDLSQWANLSKIDISGCKVEKLLLPNSSVLYQVLCDDNLLTELDIAGRTGVDELSVNGNKLTTLDLTGMTKLTEVHASNNLLTSVKLDGCTSLEDLSLDGNKLENVDLSGLAKLEGVYLYNNQLTSLDLSANNGVRYLNIDNNKLTSLNTTNLTLLSLLHANNNLIEDVDLTYNTKLTSIQLANNKLSEFEPILATYLSQLRLDGNNIETIDLSGYKSLYWATLANNKISTLNLKNNSYLQWLAVENNNLSTLDISKNTGLQGITIQGNKMQADAINNIISNLGDVSGVEINNNNKQFAKQLNISYMPGTENANVAEAQAKGWNVTAEKISTGIERLNSDSNEKPTAIYNISGERLQKTGKGINLIKMNDGKVRKIAKN